MHCQTATSSAKLYASKQIINSFGVSTNILCRQKSLPLANKPKYKMAFNIQMFFEVVY